ncbi:MAG: diguanylate cyclase domain-containing protein, partial [Arenimonas sp.]
MPIVAALTLDETERMEALLAYDVLDTPHEPVFQAITHLAATITGSPIALISLVDKERQWFKANWGLEARETPRDIAFCSHAIHSADLFEIPDTFKDGRFFDNPLVQSDPNIRFYAGYPLETDTGYKLGTLCVIDRKPKQLNEDQKNALRELSVVVMRLFEAHKQTREIENALLENEEKIRAITDSLPAMISYVGNDQHYRFCNTRAATTFGMDVDNILGRSVREVRGEALYNAIRPQIEAALRGEDVIFEGSTVAAGRRYYYRTHNVPDIDQNNHVRGFYSMTFDMTEQKQAELKLQASEHRLNLIADNMPAAICYIDRERIYRYNNATHARWLGKQVEEIINRPVREVSGEAAFLVLEPKMAQAFEGKPVDFELNVENSGDNRYVRGNAVPDFDASGVVVGIYVMMQDSTKLKRAQEKLVRLAQFDSLTALANRNRLYDKLGEALARGKRHGKELAVLYLDLDKFKSINDSLGHAGGDAALCEFANRLKASVRQTDTVARIAGDEFVILLEDLNSSAEAEQIANTILDNMKAPMSFGDTILNFSTSIGIALAEIDDDADSVLKRADDALYSAKAAGRST